MTDPLLDRKQLAVFLGISQRTVSRLKQTIPPDFILNGAPRWRAETIARGLGRMTRTRRRRTLPGRGDNGCFVSGNDATRGGESAGREILENHEDHITEPADCNVGP